MIALRSPGGYLILIKNILSILTFATFSTSYVQCAAKTTEITKYIITI